MSDTPMDSTWWLASDGKWYPPTSHPNYRPASSPDAPTPPGPNVIGTPGAGPGEIIDRAVKGQQGEQATAAELMKLPHTYHVIHGLKKGPGRSDIDHVVIGITGVWVIDSKHDAGVLTKGKGTLWIGSYPITGKIESVEAQAKYARGVLGVDTNAVLCFTQAQLPQPAQMVGRVRVLEVGALSDHIQSSPVVMTEAHVKAAVEKVADWRRKPPPIRSAGAPPTQPPSRSQRSSPPPPSPPPAGAGGRRPIARLVVGLLALLGLVIVIGVVVTFAVGTTAKATRSLIAPPGTTTTLVGPGWLTVSIDCPAPNGGHRLRPKVDGGTPGKVRVSATVNGAPHYLGEFGPYYRIPPVMGIAPNTTVGFDIQLVNEVGQAAPGYHIDITTPPSPC